MTHNLYKVLGGMNVKFPIQYRSEYVDPKDYEELNKKEAEEAAEREKGGWSTTNYIYKINYHVRM